MFKQGGTSSELVSNLESEFDAFLEKLSHF